MDDPLRRPSPDLSALLDAIKRRNREARAQDAAPKAANRRALARALGGIFDTPREDR